MNNSRFARVATLLLALVMVLGIFASCKGDGNGTTNTQDPSTSGESTYQHYQDHGGKTYNILNLPDGIWFMITTLDPKDPVDEVRQNIHIRNEKVFGKANAKITEVNGGDAFPEWKYNQLIENSMLSGAEKYDAAFMPLYHAGTMVPGGYYQCLNNIDTLKLTEGYWDQEMLKATSVDNKNYFVTGDIHLMANEAMWCLFFNKDMMDDKGMDYPYELVEDDEWTFAKFAEYCAKAKNLNGDSSFTAESENAIFGCASFDSIIAKMVVGMGAEYVRKNETSDLPELNIESSSFNGICQTITDFLDSDGDYIMGSSTSGDATYYENYFTSGRAMFLGAEIKAAQGFRESIADGWTFGIVPIPKNTASDNYRSTSTYQTAALTIPSNNEDPRMVCNLIDALGYESNETVIQPYFARTVEQKGLKDEESIKMLNIIRDNRTYDIGIAFNWVRKFEEELAKLLAAGDTNVSTTVKEYAGAIQNDISNTVDFIMNPAE